LDVTAIRMPRAALADVVKGISSAEEAVVLHTKDMTAVRKQTSDHVAQTAGMERMTPGFQNMSVFLSLAS
jgi:hypothetical protein